MTYLGQQRPIRAALIGPVDRNEIYSASARYSRALAEEILPQLPAAPTRIGLGASLGALSLFHTHRRHPDSFDALFLQSGSFFRRAESYERTFPRYERIARFVGSIHRNRPERSVPVVLGCGTVEERQIPPTRSRSRKSVINAPSSSPVRCASVATRQCSASRAPSNRPKTVCVLPTSIASSIPRMPRPAWARSGCG